MLRLKATAPRRELGSEHPASTGAPSASEDLMRASISRSFRIGEQALCDAVRQLEQILSANGVDEISGLNFYFTPRSGGSELVLYTPAGERIDHLKIETENRRVFRSPRNVRPIASTRVRSPDKSREIFSPRWALADVGYLREKWRLSEAELTTLLGVRDDRLHTLLGAPETRLTDAEHNRISALCDINRHLLDAHVVPTVADWLRSDCTMSLYPATTPLTQLLSGGEPAINHMRSALHHYVLLAEYGPNPGELQHGFDDLLKMRIDAPSWWNSLALDDE